MVYGQFTITIASGIFPSQSIGIPIYSRPSLINISNNLNKNFHNDKKFKIMEFINNKVDKKNFTEQEISELQQLVYSEFREGKTVEQVIDELRGGGILDDDAYLLGVLLGVTFILLYTISPTQALKPILNYRNVVDFSNFGGPLHPHMKGYRSAARCSYTARSIRHLNLQHGKISISKLVMQGKLIDSGLEGNSVPSDYRQLPDLLITGTNIGKNAVLKVTARSVVRHLHHADVFGIDPLDYGMKKVDLAKLKSLGIDRYMSQGGPQPPAELIYKLQFEWKRFAETPNVRYYGIGIFMNSKCHIFMDPKSKVFLALNVHNGASRSCYQLTSPQAQRFQRFNKIGMPDKQ